MKNSRLLGALCISLSLAFWSFGSNAAMISFDDGSGTQDGTITYAGDGGAMVGSGIDFHTIVGTDTPLNAGSGSALTCVDCVLSFTTGNNISEGPSVWTFAGGGTLKIEGTLKDGATTIVSNAVLVTGTFTEAFVTGSGALSMQGFGADTKHVKLLEYFGITEENFTFTDTNILMDNVVIDESTGGFSGTVTNADFDNTAVPLPAAAWLFGSALLGLVGVARRQVR